jgi:hypothetical protein
MQGMICHSTSISAKSNVKVDVSKLNAGVYNLVLSNGSNTYRAKFIKL